LSPFVRDCPRVWPFPSFSPCFQGFLSRECPRLSAIVRSCWTNADNRGHLLLAPEAGEPPAASISMLAAFRFESRHREPIAFRSRRRGSRSRHTPCAVRLGHGTRSVPATMARTTGRRSEVPSCQRSSPAALHMAAGPALKCRKARGPFGTGTRTPNEEQQPPCQRVNKCVLIGKIL
jgi:hypothetical protein